VRRLAVSTTGDCRDARRFRVAAPRVDGLTFLLLRGLANAGVDHVAETNVLWQGLGDSLLG
jgi:hypothetical protein